MCLHFLISAVFFHVSVNEILSGKRYECSSVKEEAENVLIDTIKANERKSRFSKIKILVLSVLSVFLAVLTLFFAFDMPEYISHRVQGGYMTVAFFCEGFEATDFESEILHDGERVQLEQSKNTAFLYSDYGEYRGSVRILSDDPDLDALTVDFGFVNTNNWHKIAVTILVEKREGSVSARQIVSYLTDDRQTAAHISEASTSAERGEKRLNVFKGGV